MDAGEFLATPLLHLSGIKKQQRIDYTDKVSVQKSCLLSTKALTTWCTKKNLISKI